MTGRTAARRRRVAALVVAAAAAGLPLAPRRAAAEHDEPPPRPVFFLEPDAQTEREIADLVNNSFKDVNKVVTARDLIVRRYRLVAVPALVRVLEANTNEPEVWASTLAIAALRRAEGPHPALWPAIPALVRLLKEAPEWRRGFAALAVGQFYGVAGIGYETDPPSAGEDGPRSRARRAAAEGVAALGEALSHPLPQVRTCAALALAKTGGHEAWNHVASRARAVTGATDATDQDRAALLLALALLPGPDEGRLDAVLTSVKSPLRAAGALGTGLRAAKAWAKEGAAPTPDRVASLDRLLVNSEMKIALVDGAEATYARGALALHDPASRTWDALYLLALAPSTSEETAVAAAQGLLFAPEQHEVRGKIAEFVSRDNAGTALKEPVLAAFLVIAGSDGTQHGVAACAQFLRRRERNPRGRPDADVRTHAAVGLLRGFARGRIAGADRAFAADALSEALARGLAVRGEGTFHDALSRVLTDSLHDALAGNPDARVQDADLARLEAAAPDPHALLARDPIDVAAHRLDEGVRRILGLDNLKKAVVRDGGGARDVTKDTQPLRYLDGWVAREPYLLRRDLYDDRGLPGPAAPFSRAEAALRIER